MVCLNNLFWNILVFRVYNGAKSKAQHSKKNFTVKYENNHYNEANVTRHWYIIDAKDQTVGRLAT